MPIVDAPFLIDLQHGRDAAFAATERLAERAEPNLLPMQAALEFVAGVEDVPAALRDLEETYDLVPFGDRELMRAAELPRHWLAEGSLPGWADIQVAAVAMLESTVVVTANADHFRALGCPAWNYRKE